VKLFEENRVDLIFYEVIASEMYQYEVFAFLVDQAIDSSPFTSGISRMTRLVGQMYCAQQESGIRSAF